MPSNGVQGGDENDQSSLDNNDTTLARAQRGLMLELLGVSFTSFQCSLGEASLLALAGKFDGSLLPQLSSSSSVSLSLDSYSAVDNDNSVRIDHADERGPFFARRILRKQQQTRRRTTIIITRNDDQYL